MRLVILAYSLHNLISLQPPRNTRSSSVITLARPPTPSSLKTTSRSFRHASPHLWDQLPHSLRQRSAMSWSISSWLTILPWSSHLISVTITTLVIHHPIILSFQSQNFSFCQILSSIDIWHSLGLTPQVFGSAHGFYVYSFRFFGVLVFTIILYFSVFSYFSCLNFSHFLTFVSFAFNTISILSISHFIFLLNISVLFSLCAKLNWQFVCQWVQILHCIVLYCIVWGVWGMSLRSYKEFVRKILKECSYVYRSSWITYCSTFLLV